MKQVNIMNDQEMTMDELIADDDAKTEARIAHESATIDAFVKMMAEAETEEPGLPICDLWDRLWSKLDDKQKAEAFFQLLENTSTPTTGTSGSRANFSPSR